MKATFDADFSTFNTEVDKSVVKMQTFEHEATKMGPAVETTIDKMRTSFSQFDSTMNAVGLHLGQQVKALEEITAAAGKTASQLGAIATGGLVIGTAMAAWDFGRMIAGWTGADKVVAQLATDLFGLADVTKEVAAAQQDTINKAISEGAAKTITYAEAVKYLTEKQKEQLKAQKEYEEAIKALIVVGGAWQEVIKTIPPQIAEQARRYLELGASVKDVAAAFKISEAQVHALVEANKDLAAAEKAVLAVEGERKSLKAASPSDLLGIGTRVPQSAFEDMVKGAEDIKRAYADLTDYMASVTQSTTDYQITKIHEWAEAQKAAFKGDLVERQQYNILVEAMENEKVERIKAKVKEAADIEAEARRRAINELIGAIPEIGHGPTAPTPWSTLAPAPLAMRAIGVQYRETPVERTVDVNVTGVIDEKTLQVIIDRIKKELMQDLARQLPNA